MATPKELRADIVEGRAQVQEALHGAHEAWDRKPAGSPEGEDAWSPKQVAQHLVGGEWYWTNEICKACGAPEVARPDLAANTPAQAAATLTRNAPKFDDLLRHVSDTDLEKPMGSGAFAGRTVGQVLEMWPSHVRDHINQLKAASA